MKARIWDLRRYRLGGPSVEKREFVDRRTLHCDGWPSVLLHARPFAIDDAGHLGLLSQRAAWFDLARMVGRLKYPLEARPVHFVRVPGFLARGILVQFGSLRLSSTGLRRVMVQPLPCFGLKTWIKVSPTRHSLANLPFLPSGSNRTLLPLRLTFR